MFPGCIVLKNDANYLQGVPDILMLWANNWAAFEVKISQTASHQANQGYYVNLMNEMSFAAFVWPGNESDVLNDLQLAFQSGRAARLPQRQ
jgi:hypothetical protein